MTQRGRTCLLLLLRADEAADVNPNPLQEEQEGQQVEEQSDSLERDGGTEERGEEEGGDRYSSVQIIDWI